MSRLRRMSLVFGAALTIVVAAGAANAQVLRGRGSAAQAQPQQPPAPPASAQVGQGQAEAQTGGQAATARANDAQFQAGAIAPVPAPDAGHARIIRGSTLVGTAVWASQTERLGTVKDIVFDLSGGCTQYVVLESPALGQQWVVVPVDAMRLEWDAQNRSNYFLLSMPVAQLRQAPHIQVNQWDMIQNPQFLTRTRDFYRSVERTATRPGGAASSESRSQQQGELRSNPNAAPRAGETQKGNAPRSESQTKEPRAEKSPPGNAQRDEQGNARRDDAPAEHREGSQPQPGRSQNDQRPSVPAKSDQPRLPQGNSGQSNGQQPRSGDQPSSK